MNIKNLFSRNKPVERLLRDFREEQQEKYEHEQLCLVENIAAETGVLQQIFENLSDLADEDTLAMIEYLECVYAAYSQASTADNTRIALYHIRLMKLIAMVAGNKALFESQQVRYRHIQKLLRKYDKAKGSRWGWRKDKWLHRLIMARR